jgi:hypothetical protein
MVLAWLAFGLGGCAHTYETKVVAIAKPKATEATSYRVRVKNSPTPNDDLRIREAENHVKTALSGQGLYEAPKEELADLIVELDYGIGPPRTRQEEVREPVYRTRPGRLITQTVQVGPDRNGNPIYQTTTYQEPSTTEYIGDRVYYITVITYEKHLALTAHETKQPSEGQPRREVWRVEVSCDDESKDLREYVPVLAAASIDYIGKNTDGAKAVAVKATNPDVAFVRKGL